MRSDRNAGRWFGSKKKKAFLVKIGQLQKPLIVVDLCSDI